MRRDTPCPPTLVGVGERASEGGPETDLTAHVEQIVSLIGDQAPSRVVLVGFSYSGLVVEGVAAAIPDRIAQLVLIDALVAPKGKCGFDLLPASVVERLCAAARDEGEGWRLPPFPLELVGGIGSVEPGLSSADIERTLERRGTHPIGTYEESVTWDESSLAEVSRRYVICTDKPSPVRERFLARVDELRAVLNRRRLADWPLPDAKHADGVDRVAVERCRCTERQQRYRQRIAADLSAAGTVTPVRSRSRRSWWNSTTTNVPWSSPGLFELRINLEDTAGRSVSGVLFVSNARD